MQVEAQSEWPHSTKKSAQTYIYQIKALEQLVVMGMRMFAAGRTVTHAEPREDRGSWGAWRAEMPQKAVRVGWACERAIRARDHKLRV